MKNLFYLYFISALFFASCDEFISIDEEIISPPEEVIPPADTDENNTPSDFDFTSLQAGDTLNIAFSHDLDGKSIEIPADVVINYNAGEIVNGTFVFTEGKIAGELLNQDLTIEGTPTLTSTTFKFEKSKWNITEGEVSDDIASINKKTFQQVIDDMTSYGAEIFQIDELDAYFLVSSDKNLRWSKDEAISLPSNITLEMTDNTHLRVQANKYFRYALFELRSVTNVNLIGGNLYGDRDFHNYDPIANGSSMNTSHEWGHLIQIVTGVNVRIENMYLADAAGDGIQVCSLNHTFNPNYVGSSNISIKDCILDGNRRNNISITDGHDMIIENNTFLNAGIDTDFSKGTAPRLALDVEAVSRTDANGVRTYYEKAYDITIRNNTEKGSVKGAFYVAIGQDVTIENNVTEGFIGFGTASGVKIIGNKVTRQSVGTGIVGGRLNNDKTITGNEISNNTVVGCIDGIRVFNSGVKVSGNEVRECKYAITIRGLGESEIYDNKISSDVTNAYGIYAFSGNVDDVLIRDNVIDIAYKPIAFTKVNFEAGQESNTVTVKNNDLNGGKVHISNSNGIILE